MQLTQETNSRSLTQVFEYEGHGVRVVGTPESPLFVVGDVCRVLGIRDASKSILRLDDDEKSTNYVRTPGGREDMLCVTESGLYALILNSRKPKARALRRWITREVLPAIRKLGRFAVTTSSTEQLQSQARVLVQHERRQSELETRIQAMERRLAAVEARQSQRTTGFSSVSAYLKQRRLCLDLNSVIEFTRLAGSVSEERGIPVGRITDPRFGLVNTYHIEVLDEVASRWN